MAKVFRLTKPGAARKGGVNFLGKLLMSTRLAKLIRLLASDKSGEVVAAAGAINRALAAAGLDIHRLADVVERSPLVPGQMPPPPCDDSTAGDWRAMRRFCADHDTLLSARGKSIRPRYQTLARQAHAETTRLACLDLPTAAGRRRGFAASAATRRSGAHRRKLHGVKTMADEFPETDLDTPTEHDIDEAYGSRFLGVGGYRRQKTSARKY